MDDKQQPQIIQPSTLSNQNDQQSPQSTPLPEPEQDEITWNVDASEFSHPPTGIETSLTLREEQKQALNREPVIVNGRQSAVQTPQDGAESIQIMR